ncbi:hypothetical protein C8R46DRAFT_1195921 [Mycena filopes]|nr:hypothetical protein C8R46DRAFT_1195921 [Mycena filopes]
MQQPMSPPPPFPEFVDFSFDGSMFPTPPPLPSSADLFSPAETTDLLGFLDNFNDFSWETTTGGDQHQNQIIEQQQQPEPQAYTSPRLGAPYSNPHLNTAPEPSTSGRPPRRSTRRSTAASRAPPQQPQPQLRTRRGADRHRGDDRDSQTPSETSSHSHPEQSSSSQSQSQSQSQSAVASTTTPTAVPRGSKPLLSTPQKRLNHIMSEQKRRNAIRDGYAQLIALLAPAGSAPGLGMPQRGRPKGSGSRGGKGGQKGKSGVLFRAVEYIRWLEEGRDALREEVGRVEAVAGIRS